MGGDSDALLARAVIACWQDKGQRQAGLPGTAEEVLDAGSVSHPYERRRQSDFTVTDQELITSAPSSLMFSFNSRPPA